MRYLRLLIYKRIFAIIPVTMHHSSDVGRFIHLLVCATEQSPRVAIRITPDRKYASAIDFIRIVSESKQPKCVWNSVKKEMTTCSDQRSQQDHLMLKSHHFSGKGQKPTPVVSAQGIIALLFLIPGRKAKEFSRQCCDILIRFMEGDVTLVDKINKNNETSNALFQENVQQKKLQRNRVEAICAKLESKLVNQVKCAGQEVKGINMISKS
jgi:hypothetical protein